MQPTQLDRASLIAYRQRWQAVAAVEAAERQASTLQERWQQLNALLCLARNLDIVPQEEDMDESRQRWQTLYAHHQAKSA
jgi:hypothetical protein